MRRCHHTRTRALILGCALALLAPRAAAHAGSLDDEHGDLELGARLGAVTGGGASAGGVHLAGTLLYRLSDIDWFEGGLSVIVGSGDADCFTDRQGAFVCNHGPVDGRAAELSAGIRRYVIPGEYFAPYVGARVGVRVVSFPGDQVRGLALPLLISGGVRAQVARAVTVHGGATLELGLAFFNRDLGMTPQAALAVHMGVEIALD